MRWVLQKKLGERGEVREGHTSYEKGGDQDYSLSL